jgi:tetratricopeptide (TPR) repeat protein
LQNFYLPLVLEIVLFFGIILFACYLFKANKNRFKIFLFFSMWLFLGLFLHSQTFPLDWTVADRWFYFSIVGMLGMIGVLAQTMRHAKKLSKLFYYSIAVIILFSLSVRTVVRNTNWLNAITLYTHDTKIVDSWDIENNLGFEYKYLDNQPEALKHYLRSVELFPFESNHLNVGIVYGNMGNQKKAIEYYYKALASKHYPTSSHKHNTNIYISLINALLIADRVHEAKKVTMEALRDYPNAPELWGELAIIQQWMHEDDNALDSARKAKGFESTQLTNYIYEKIINKQKINIYPGKNEVKIL